jgi:hypothetical protein
LKSLNKFGKSWQFWLISTVSMKILTQLNLDWKVSILKISTEKKNNLVLTVRIISTSFKSWSRQIEKSWSGKVLTVKTPRLNFDNYLDQDFSSQHFCYSVLQNWLPKFEKSQRNWEISKCLGNSWKSQLVLKVSTV